MKSTRKLAALTTTLIIFGSLTGGVDAALTFTIDTFTSDELTITIPTSSAVLEATDAAPASADLYVVATVGLQKYDWIVGSDHTAVGAGQIGGATVNLGSLQMIDNQPSVGDFVFVTFDRNLIAGDAVTSEVTVSWTGTNIFDPTAVDSLTLTWGTEDLFFAYPWGDVQSSTAVVVPEPSAALLLGIGALGLVVRRKKNNIRRTIRWTQRSAAC